MYGTEYADTAQEEAAEVATRADATQAPDCLESLNRDTKTALGALYGAPAGIAEMTIATFGYWIRVVLAQEGIIQPFEEQTGSGTDQAKERPTEVVITSAGRKVMAACADKFAKDIQAETNMDLLRQEREAYKSGRAA
jgi:hypothetical protein